MYKRWRIKRIGLITAVKIGGAVSCIMGFILGTLWGLGMAFFSSLMGTMLSMNTTGFGLAALVFFPFLFALIYGVLGMVFSFFFALLYNLVSGILGGIEVEIDEEKKYEYDDIYGVL